METGPSRLFIMTPMYCTFPCTVMTMATFSQAVALLWR